MSCRAIRIYYYGESRVSQVRAIVQTPFRPEPGDGMPEMSEEKPGRPPLSRWRRWPAIFLAAGLLWGAWAWWTDRDYRDAILRIELDMANGRFGAAARSLTKILESWPDCDEAAVLLARCEQERGRDEAAAKALSRIEPGSLFSHKAILARMRLCARQGETRRRRADRQ